MRPRLLAITSLEERANPAWSISLIGNAVSFTCDAQYDSINLSRGPGGYLEHTIFDGGFASQTDLDASRAGVQRRLVSQLTSISVGGVAADTYASIEGIHRPILASVSELSINVGTLANVQAALTDTSFSIAGSGQASYTHQLSSVSTVYLTLFGGNNSFDGSLFNGSLAIYGSAGNDTLIGGSSFDFLDGAGGNDVLIGNGSFDTFFGGPGDDQFNGGDGTDTFYDDVIGNAIVSNTTSTINGFTVNNHQVETFDLTGNDSSNLIDASAFTGLAMLRGNGGNDTLRGGSANDLIQGGEGNDVIEGNGQGDVIQGDDGNDTILGGDGDDQISAGTGDDSIDAGDGTDFLADTLGGAASYNVVWSPTSFTISINGGAPFVMNHHAERVFLTGGSGNDFIDGSSLTDRMNAEGGLGNDTLIGTAFADDLRGGGGNDSIDAAGGADLLYGNGGDDTIFGGPGIDYIEGGTGDDYLDGGDEADTVVGDSSRPFNPQALTTDGNDTLLGGSGDDELSPNGGTDEYDGGPGFDRVYDAFTNSSETILLTNTELSVQTGAGTPVVFAHGSEWFFLFAQGGNDVLDASAFTTWNTVLDGGDGNDSILGSINPDFLTGGKGNDTLRGGGGNDTLADTSYDATQGAGGDDVFDGGDGNDDLRPEGGNDTVFGGNDNDTINTEAGDDQFDGGDGYDTVNDLLFTRVGGIATITDTEISIQQPNGTFATFAHHAERFEVGGSDGNDTIDASGYTSGQVVLYGRQGNDLLKAGTGLIQHFLWGGAGNDTLLGGPFHDSLIGDDYGSDLPDGNDSIVGGDGNDQIEALGGNNTIYGGNGDDQIAHRNGGSGIVDGGADVDIATITSGIGPDSLIVRNDRVQINGRNVFYAGLESMSLFTGEGIDSGRQVGLVATPYTVGEMEASVSIAPQVTSATRTVIAAGSFIDIGAGQTFTASVDYGDGSPPESLVLTPDLASLENRHTFSLNHTYARSGHYTVVVTVNDDNGNFGSRSIPVTIGPTVTAIRATYGNNLFSSVDARVLSWFGVRQLAVTFSDDVSVQQSDLTLSGPSAPAIVGFRYDVTTKTGYWTLSRALGMGRFTLTIDGDSNGAVVDRQGARLAGNGVVGTDYRQVLAVLPGDFNGDRIVNTADVSSVNALIGGPYDAYADVNGDGIVDARDVQAVRSRLGTRLP